jgi:hypothetical protein
MSIPLTNDEQHVLDHAVSRADGLVMISRNVDPSYTVEALVARGLVVVLKGHEQGPAVSVFGETSQGRRALASL